MTNRLKVLRAERGWTQHDVAEKVGVTRQTIHSIEVGKYDPSLPLAMRLALLFGLRVEEVFALDDGA